MATEPLLTWNLFLTMAGLPALGWWIGYQIKRKDKLQNDNMTLWQDGAKERSNAVNARLDRMQDCLAAIKEDLNGKRDNHECERIHDVIEKKVDKLESKLWT